MSKKKLNRDDLRLLVLPLGLVLVVVLGGVFVFGPRIKETFFLRHDNQEKKTKAEILETKAEILEGLSGSTIKEELGLALKALPVGVNLPLLGLILEQTAARRSLEIRAFSLGDADTTKNFLECTAVGTKDNLEAFFVDLENSLPLLDIEKIILSDSEGKLEAEFVLRNPILALEEKIEPGQKVDLLTKEEEKILTDLEEFSSMVLPTLQSLPSTGGSRSDPFFF